MRLKCSPGPWEAVDRLTVRSRFVAGDADSGGWLVAALPAHASEGDAALIAAAPELLEVALACLLREDIADDELGELLRAAIAKATGSAA